MGLPWRAGVSKVKIPAKKSFQALSREKEGLQVAGSGVRRRGWVSSGSRSSVRSCPRDEPWCSAQIHLSSSSVVCLACKSVITVYASCRANSDFYDIALFIQIFIYLPYHPPLPRPSRQLIWSFKVEENKTVWRRVGARKSRTAVTGTGTLLNYEEQVSAFKIQAENRAEGRAGPLPAAPARCQRCAPPQKHGNEGNGKCPFIHCARGCERLHSAFGHPQASLGFLARSYQAG